MVTIAELQAQINALQAQLMELQANLPSANFNFNDNFFISNEDLTGIDDKKKEGYKKIFRDGIVEMRYEINRMEKFIENFSQRGAALMTIAGLISLLPYAFSNNSLFFLKHYLIWIFPFLTVAILAYIISSSKRHTYRTSISTAAENVFEELVILRNEALAAQDIWRESYLNHQRSLRWHRINSIFTQLFLFNYVLNFYLFIFFDIPSIKNMIIITILLLITGTLLYIKNRLASFDKKFTKNKTEKKELSVDLSTGVGGAPPENII